jgi:hypothetical protein
VSYEEWIRRGKLHAVGRYQFIGTTLASLVSQGHAKPSDKFDQSTQNKLAVALIKQVGTNPSRLKGTWIGLSHETDAAIRAAVGKGGDITGGTNGGGISSNGGTSSSGSGTTTKKKVTLADIMGGESTRPVPVENYKTGNINSHGDARSIIDATEERNRARQRANEKSSQMVQAAIEAVRLSNTSNEQIIMQAQQGIQQAMQMGSGNSQPQVIPTGGGRGAVKSVVSSLASSINPLRGIFK